MLTQSSYVFGLKSMLWSPVLRVPAVIAADSVTVAVAVAVLLLLVAFVVAAVASVVLSRPTVIGKYVR
jgi:uncharacterized membrane protein (DUF485 family)